MPLTILPRRDQKGSNEVTAREGIDTDIWPVSDIETLGSNEVTAREGIDT